MWGDQVLMRQINLELKRLLLLIAPSLVVRIQNSYRTSEERELELVSALCASNKTSVDVGGDNGDYVLRMLPHSKNCVVCEPRRNAFQKLSHLFGLVKRRVTVENIAVSDYEGEAEIFIPQGDGGRASIEHDNPVTQEAERVDRELTRVRRLDSLGLPNIGFIKIDVEGHELSVLKGAEGILRAQAPAVLLESERRHNKNCPEAIFEFMNQHDYAGYFVNHGKLQPTDEFDVAQFQNEDSSVRKATDQEYINNFIFLPRDRPTSDLQALLAK